MATPGTPTPKKEKKDESLFDKIGTLARKKKVKEGNHYEFHIIKAKTTMLHALHVYIIDVINCLHRRESQY